MYIYTYTFSLRQPQTPCDDCSEEWKAALKGYLRKKAERRLILLRQKLRKHSRSERTNVIVNTQSFSRTVTYDVDLRYVSIMFMFLDHVQDS